MATRNSALRVVLLVAVAAFSWGIDVGPAMAAPVTGPGDVPDYFETPNWANSPPLRKFVDNVAGLGPGGVNNLGQFISVAAPDNTTFPGSDYYEIALVQYREQMHSDLPPLTGSKTAPTTTGGTLLRGYIQEVNGVQIGEPHYLGPLIVAQKDRPVRIKFTNRLPTGNAGNLFVPVDNTIMGSGAFEINYDPLTNVPRDPITGTFAQNRATLHLHGGRTPWISDGTPHQWTVPAGEATSYPKGASNAYVPDMWFDASGNLVPNSGTCTQGTTTCTTPGATNNPGPGMMTFYYTNQQSARMMFYHDHAWGITRLNVYAGEAAGYLIQDNVEKALVEGGTVGGRTFAPGTIPADQIPLVVQFKTFVNAAAIDNTDPTWNWGSNPPARVTGDLWWPHVYMPAQNPYATDFSGVNAMGRWMYGPWFWPPTPLCFEAGGTDPEAVPPYCITHTVVTNPYFTGFGPPNPNQPPYIPGTPNVSWGAEAFLDTPMVNGTVFPAVTVEPKAYRLRILNADHDKFLNLQLYQAANNTGPTTPGAGTPIFTGTPDQLTEVAMVDAAPRPACSVTIRANCVCTPTDAPAGCFPETWPADGREGGVPHPATAGPDWIMIGTEGGFLSMPAVIPTNPVIWNLDPTMFNVGNVIGGSLRLGPAERADVIVDFSAFAGQTLILYNDAPSAFPALDPHYDYYTGAPDRTDIGGYGPVQPGVGPNVRTIMQINVAALTPAPFDSAPLFAAFNGPQSVFAQGQDEIVVGQSAYDNTYNTTFPVTWPEWGISTIYDTSLTFRQVDNTLVSNYPIKPKSIHDEMGGTFDDYGRMSAKLGLEVPFSNAAIATFALQNYVDPPTERVREGEIQIWKITHNGVDTHPVHFHLFDVQIVNRVGWDGFIRLPDPDELGWKDTIRVSPLEDTIVALRPVAPRVPFRLPDSIRPLNPSMPLGSLEGFSRIDPLTGGALEPALANQLWNFGYEYVWHCHILSHEENDMMRATMLLSRRAKRIDFEPDSKTDAAVWRPSTGQWFVLRTLDGAVPTPAVLGSPTDRIVPGDYDGDGKTDAAVWDNATGTWTIQMSSFFSSVITTQWGDPTDIPVPGDFDGDGKADPAVYRPSNGVWFFLPSKEMKDSGVPGVPAYPDWTRYKAYAWGGAPTDIPIAGDYDGDGLADPAVYRASEGVWYILQSSTGYLPAQYAAYKWGEPVENDIPVPGDYDGDGKTDPAVYRPGSGTWFILESSNGYSQAQYKGYAWGGDPDDVPVPGDYDGDGLTDPAVYRKSTGTWMILQSSNGYNMANYLAYVWGVAGDVPLKSLY